MVIPSLKGWPTKSKEALPPHEVRLTLLDTNQVFQFQKSKQLSRKITDHIGIDCKTTYQMLVKDFIKIDLRLVECERS